MDRKIFIFFLALCLTIAISAISQHKKNILFKGDSLFEAKNYEDALKIYKEIHENNIYSPAMLLKMAYIEEQKGDVPNALYYLSSYYYLKPDREIHIRMERMASKINLKGYDYTDFEYFNYLYRENYYYIISFLLSLSGIYFVHLILKKIKGNPFGIRPLIFFAVLISLFYFTNFDFSTPKVITRRNNVLIMTNPAAGSDVASVVSRGQQFRVIGKEDIWYRIELENRTNYVRKSDVWLIGKL